MNYTYYGVQRQDEIYCGVHGYKMNYKYCGVQRQDGIYCGVHGGRMNYTYCGVQRQDEIHLLWSAEMQRQDESIVKCRDN
jgi:hypothetical protein